MDRETVTLFFGILAVVAQVAVAAIVLVALAAAVSPSARRFASRARDELAPQAMALAAAVAAVCTGGSLYLSEVANFRPCQLCWYQRYAMYPLVAILAVGALARGAVARWTRIVGLVMAVVGGSISVWHILIERGVIEESAACDLDNPCSVKWIEELGYLTIPTMALSGFALIAVLLVVATVRSDRSPEETP